MHITKTSLFISILIQLSHIMLLFVWCFTNQTQNRKSISSTVILCTKYLQYAHILGVYSKKKSNRLNFGLSLFKIYNTGVVELLPWIKFEFTFKSNMCKFEDWPKLLVSILSAANTRMCVEKTLSRYTDTHTYAKVSRVKHAANVNSVG